jgi:3-oxoacyl-[acyl-carrier protein] reductase
VDQRRDDNPAWTCVPRPCAPQHRRGELTGTTSRVGSTTTGGQVAGGRFDGKVAIVTGAGGGIGREHARLFAKEGAKVVVNDLGTRTGANATSVVDEIVADGGEAIANTTSATWDGAPEIVQAALDAFGRVDVLVNNATAGGNNDIWRFTEKDWDLSFDVNLKGYFAMIRALAPHFCSRGSGAIVNTSSGSGFGHPSHVAYASAKEGVVGLTRTVARELGRFGVRCNAIRPLAAGASTKDYAVKTARWTQLMEVTMSPRGARPRPGGQSFDPELIPPRKISPLVVWLCTDAASNVNGRTFHVTGDQVSRLSEPAPERMIRNEGGWTLDALDAVATAHLVGDLTNDYTLDEYPELKVFEE